MNIIRHFQTGQQVNVVRALSSFEVNDLRNESIRFQAILKNLRENNYWIECDCCTDQQPIMAIRRQSNGVFTLINLSKHPQHNKNCAFFRVSSDVSERTSGQRLSRKQGICFHHAVRDVDTNPQQEKVRERISSGVGSQSSKLNRLLCSLFDVAGLHAIKAASISPNDHYFALQATAKTFSWQHGESLDTYFWTHHHQLIKAYQTLRARKDQWPESMRPQGLLLVVIDAVSEHQLHIGDTTLEIQGHIEKPGVVANTQGPFVALITLSDEPSKPLFFAMQRACVLPLLSKRQLMIVDSHYERRVIETVLKDWLPYWTKKGLQVTLKKPLFDIPVTELVCRPDLVLSTPAGDVILEVMGRDDEAYIERKQRTVPLMQQLGTVVEFNALVADRAGQWNEQLTFALRGVTKFLFELRTRKVNA